jgi:hypothetical protein
MPNNDHLSFSDALVSILSTNESYDYLPMGTWTEGGCTLLAQALLPLLGTDHSLLMVGRPMEDGRVLDHMVVKTPCGHYIDGNGLQTEDELLRTMHDEWGFNVIQFSEPDFEILEAEGLLYHPADVKAFRKYLSGQQI